MFSFRAIPFPALIGGVLIVAESVESSQTKRSLLLQPDHPEMTRRAPEEPYIRLVPRAEPFDWRCAAVTRNP